MIIRKTIKVRPGSIAWMYFKHKKQIKFYTQCIITLSLLLSLFYWGVSAYAQKHQERYEECLNTSSELFCMSRF